MGAFHFRGDQKTLRLSAEQQHSGIGRPSLVVQVEMHQYLMRRRIPRRIPRQWFEVASFPIFNVGGLGSLEELGITLCNMKLSISEQVPIILFDTETGGAYWNDAKNQIEHMVRLGRAPAWIKKNLIMTDDPAVVIDAYRSRLHLF
jgi:predicted Rossmann-fold nucleotide-binding protein